MDLRECFDIIEDLLSDIMEDLLLDDMWEREADLADVTEEISESPDDLLEAMDRAEGECPCLYIKY